MESRISDVVFCLFCGEIIHQAVVLILTSPVVVWPMSFEPVPLVLFLLNWLVYISFCSSAALALEGAFFSSHVCPDIFSLFVHQERVVFTEIVLRHQSVDFHVCDFQSRLQGFPSLSVCFSSGADLFAARQDECGCQGDKSCANDLMFSSLFFFIYDFLVLRSLILCGVFHPFQGIHGLYDVMPRLRITALWPAWVFGKRPFSS